MGADRIMSYLSALRMISTASLAGSLGVIILMTFADTAGLLTMQLVLQSRGTFIYP